MIQLQFQYRSFASLKVDHLYYSKGLSRDLHFHPAPESKAHAERIGLLIKTSPAGISISYDVTSGDAFLRYLLANEEIYFDFYLLTRNYHFVNFTDMPTESVGSLYYYDTSLAVPDEAGASYRLHKGPHASDQERFSSVKASFYRDYQGKEGRYSLQDDGGRVLRELPVTGKYAVDMKGLPAGRYHVLEDGKKKQTFVYQPLDFQRRNIIALVKLSLTGEMRQSMISVLEKGEVLPNRSFEVRFDTRSTYWKYFIVSKYKLPLEKSGIDTLDSGIEFTGPEKVPLANGDTAYLFESKKPLPLKEMQDLSFKLSKDKKSGRDNGEAYLNRLPTPTPEVIKPASRDKDAKVYSELIVYV